MNSAIIVAAGQGVRMGTNVDKLFIELAGRPLIAHTWQRFDSCACIDEIVLVVRSGAEETIRKMPKRLGFQKPFRIALGGRERQDSVWNGLQAVARNAEIVAIQDGARPCTSDELIHATMDVARELGAAVAAQRVTDTIKRADNSGRIEATVDRARLWAVQTPQAFRLEVIRQAMEAVRRTGAVVTDDTAACELIGQPVKLVESTLPNPKATSPADLPYIEMLLTRAFGSRTK
jgi:2-C-methyl-D-erythritol 4-phosphate cytidylyltransferase